MAGRRYYKRMVKKRRRELRQEVLSTLRDFLNQPEGEPFELGLAVHAADLADVMWFDLDSAKANRVFCALSLEHQAEVLAEAEPKLQGRLLDGWSPEAIGPVLTEMSADDGADVLEVLPEEIRLQVICFVEPEDAAELRHLSEYPAESAGGLMTTEFLTAREDENVGDILRAIKRDEGESETISAIYVADEVGTMLGVVSTRELLEAGIHDPVGDIMIPDVIMARVDEDQEAVAHRILHYNLSSIPVVDPRGVIVGIVTADDALEVLEDEGSEDVLLLAGAGGSADASEPLLTKVWRRGPMLLITVMAGLMMSRVMEYFAPGSETADAAESPWRVLISFIPMVLALSGTVGAQTSAVVVRGFAVGQIGPGRRGSAFTGEVQVGVALGFLCAILAAPAMALFVSDWDAGASMGIALFLAMSWAAIASCSIAMGSEAIGLDPALVAGPVMIAVSALSAVVLFFGVASLLLN